MKRLFIDPLRLFALAIFTVGLVHIFALPAAAQARNLNAPLEKIAFAADDTLRGFVDRHLGDPDLWPYVLQLNNIGSPADVRDGVILALPVQQVRAADAALKHSLDIIQNATAQGAQVFAPVKIGSAVENRENALAEREVGAWRKVVDLSDIATLLAQEALEIAIAQRDRSAEAIVSDVQGDVEGRAPADQRWSDRDNRDILVEFERVRTLSGSTTQITFRDLSRLRLNANSNATIQRMRSDPLTGDEVTKVSLVNGDFYALLNQLSEKTAFEIDVPGVQTTTESTDFWVKNDQSGARFVNYDAADLEVTRGTTKVTLGENEGVVLNNSGGKTVTVLDSPLLSQPPLAAILYSGVVDMAWGPFDGAAGYWIEVASDAGFNQMQVSEWGVEAAAFQTPQIAAGRYFWRVAALDALGLPGQWSKTNDFIIRHDTTPPFLTVLAPGDGTLSDQATIEAFGASEPDAAVLLNGAPVTLGADGSFVLAVNLEVGPNTLIVQATDLAGNISEMSQTVTYRPAAVVSIAFDANLPRLGTVLATRSEDLVIRAQTNALFNAPVNVRGAGGATVVQTLVGIDGELSFSVPVSDQRQTYTIDILAPNGAIEGSVTFDALRDQVAPAITLDLPPPKATDDPLLVVSGVSDDAVALTLNGADVALTNGRFSIELDLSPDVNRFDLRATDAVGNVTVARLQTVYDIDPPDVSRATVRRPKGNAGPIEIEVAATDASGLRKSAPYLLEIGGRQREGFLRCDDATGLCRISLPPEDGKLRLIEVAIEDYAGNTAYK